MKIPTAQQIQIARKLLEYHIKGGLPLLEAFRKAAPYKVYTLRQLSSLTKGFPYAVRALKRELESGFFWVPHTTNKTTSSDVSKLIGVAHPVDASRPLLDSPVLEKSIRDFMPVARKPKILVVGMLDSQVQHIRSAKFEFVHLKSGANVEQLRANASAAEHTIVWVTKVGHDITDLLARMGVPMTYAHGISSIKRTIHILEQKH